MIILYSHKKSGLFAAFMLLALLVASIPAARADPGFTLEDVTTWRWVDDTYASSVAAADVDGDGATEIVTGGYYDDGTRNNAQLSVWDGSTMNLKDVKTWHWTRSTEIDAVAIGDVDLDGDVEIVTGGRYNDNTRWVAQLCVWDGSTLALEDVTSWYWTSHTRITSVAIAEVDGDGKTEIVTVGWYWDGTRYVAQLCVWSSSLSLEGVRTWYWTSDTFSQSVACADVDGDGSVEIVTGGTYWGGSNYRAQLCVWDGSTLALEDVTSWYWTSHTRITSVAIADVDGDTAVEIVTGGYYDDGTREVAQLCVWTGSTLALEDVTIWYWTDDTEIWSVAVGDVDGDGQTEIVTGGEYWDGTRDRAQLCVWTGSTLVLEGVTTWYWTGSTDVDSVAVADVDGDTAVEISTSGNYHDSLRNNAQLCVWGFT